MISKPKLMIVLGSMGHTTQMVRIREMLHDSYDFECVVNDYDDRSIVKVKSIGDVQENQIPGRHFPSYDVKEKPAALHSV